MQIIIKKIQYFIAVRRLLYMTLSGALLVRHNYCGRVVWAFVIGVMTCGLGVRSVTHT